ncbi:hypothetical protein Tco_0898582 [Tanacetum coccineum]
MDADEEWDGPEWILPYHGADPLYLPILHLESEAVLRMRLRAEAAGWAGLTTGSSSSAAAVGHNPEDLTPSHIRSDLDALHRRVWHIEEDDVRAENKRLRMMLDCSENRTRDAWRELVGRSWHYHHLRRWSIRVENLLPPRLQYQEPPYALPEALLAPVTHNDPRDPYVAARDVATAPATDNDDSPTQKETSPSEPQGSPPRDS